MENPNGQKHERNFRLKLILDDFDFKQTIIIPLISKISRKSYKCLQIEFRSDTHLKIYFHDLWNQLISREIKKNAPSKIISVQKEEDFFA